MSDTLTCWGPECANPITQTEGKRARRYCSGRCRQRAFQRNDRKAPDHPYPPLHPSEFVPDPRHAPTVPTDLFSDAPPAKPVRKPRSKATAPVLEVAPDAPSNVVQLPPPAAVPPPEPPPESEIVQSVRAALEHAGKTGWQADQAITVAMRMSSEATSPASVSQLSRELDRLMTELTKGDPSAAGANPADVIRARTIAKLAAVGAM